MDRYFVSFTTSNPRIPTVEVAVLGKYKGVRKLARRFIAPIKGLRIQEVD